MSIWEHKAADELASAVAHFVKKSSADSQRWYQLIGIYKDAKRAAETIATNSSALDTIRSSLCLTCRGQKLYECDVVKGWSMNCAFVKSNSS